MSALGDVRAELAGKLAAAGMAAVTDPRAVPPCVLLGAPTVNGGVGVGGWSVDYPVHVIAAPPASADTLDWLLSTVEKVLRTLGPTRADPSAYGDRQDPAYTLVYGRDVANPDC